MRPTILALGAAAAAASPWPVLAQSVLDRTDPAQEEQQEREERNEREEGAADLPPIAAEEQPSGTVPESIYAVGPIVIEGVAELSVSDFVDIVERYSGRNLTEDELNMLANEIASRARQRGYIFATAMIEPQSLRAGVLRVRLNEGVIDEIRIEGDDDPAIRAQLEPLRREGPVTLEMLERQLLLAGDISGAYIRRTYYEREGEVGVLIVEASRSDASGSIELENDGSKPVGPERARIDVDLNGLITPFDEVDLTYSTTPLQPKELQYARARYFVVANTSGTEIGADVSFSTTEPGAYLADRDVFGRFWRIGVEARHPLVRSRDASLWAEAEFEVRDLRQERDGRLARHDRIPVIRAGLYTIAKAAGGRLSGKLTYSQGLDILGATDLGDPLASRDDASAVFSSLYAWADWDRDLFSNFSLELAGRAQLSTDPLLSTEDLGLGGNSFLRGYSYSERSGDEGIMGSGELRYDWRDAAGLVRNLQLYAYADGGVVGNLADGRGSGSLASAGGGFRTDITRNLDFDAEIAVPLTGPRYDTDDQSPRINIRIRMAL